jgi:hypothetical protein
MKIPGPSWEEAYTLNFAAASSRKPGEGSIEVVLVTTAERRAKRTGGQGRGTHRRSSSRASPGRGFWVPLLREVSTGSSPAPWRSWTGFRCGGKVRMGLQRCEFI